MPISAYSALPRVAGSATPSPVATPEWSGAKKGLALGGIGGFVVGGVAMAAAAALNGPALAAGLGGAVLGMVLCGAVGGALGYTFDRV